MKTLYYIKGLFSLKPVVIDGLLCVVAASCGYWESSLGKDEAFKYWNAYALYFFKEFNGGFNAAIMALIFFRSKSYTDHLDKQKSAQADKTQIESKTNEVKTNDAPSSNSGTLTLR